MNSYKIALERKIRESAVNNFGIENYDEYRFGKFVTPQIGIRENIKKIAKKFIGYKKKYFLDLSSSEFINKYGSKLEFIYDHLDKEGRNLLIDLVAYKILGYQKVKLPLNNNKYWEALKTVKKLKDSSDTIDPHFMHFILEKFII
jgi:hypothetical protein